MLTEEPEDARLESSVYIDYTILLLLDLEIIAARVLRGPFEN